MNSSRLVLKIIAQPNIRFLHGYNYTEQCRNPDDVVIFEQLNCDSNYQSLKLRVCNSQTIPLYYNLTAKLVIYVLTQYFSSI